jgi:hypothetical protein
MFYDIIRCFICCTFIAEMHLISKYHSTTIKKSVNIVAALRTSSENKMVLLYISVDSAFIGEYCN